MKGIQAISTISHHEQFVREGKNIWIPLFYNEKNDTVYVEPGKGRELVTHLINAVSPAEIKDIIHKWKWR